ncbi:uncharacterized protein LTR77_004817 [Saxophila tyrrhenica]|uniref:Zn(2)-C6 fungal-type domain-containing protein n=1 Tax=Saxophila tyrrhenica TaxID=1690608 RepID=A0AAV9PAK5_9PEZI|nr:hypothetical protein LTR77_004817 [Saxophila tyrrhenica]
MPPPAQRPRACDNCHSIKIKCELGKVGGTGPCQRCVRLDKECKVTPPKRQKDRVAELEAEVEQLRRLLESQNINLPSPESGGDRSSANESSPNSIPPRNAGPKKRKLEEGIPEREDELTTNPEDWFTRLDAIIPQATQSKLLDRYTVEMFPRFPLVPIRGKKDFASMRAERPMLLIAILYASCSAVLHLDLQEDVAKLMFDILSKVVVEGDQKSTTILQAIQIIYLWFRAPKNHAYGGYFSIFDLVKLASDMAAELGLGGPIRGIQGKNNWHSTHRDIDNESAWRNWLVCRILSTSLCLFMRTPDSLRWDEHDESSLQMLDYWKEGGEGTRLICHIVKAEKLTERIASESGCYDAETPAIGVSDPAVQPTRLALQSAALDFESQVLPDLSGPFATFWRHIITLQLHEPVLHTPTNKRSFTAPYLAERLSVTDFPMPLVTPSHIASLTSLRDAAHSLLDIFLSFDTTTVITLPAILVHSRVAYAQYLLMRLYIATSAPGNTFGAFLDPESLRIDAYLPPLIRLQEIVSAADERCGASRVLWASPRMREWYLNYRRTFVDVAVLEQRQVEFNSALDWYGFGDVGVEGWDWGLQGLFDGGEMGEVGVMPDLEGL